MSQIDHGEVELFFRGGVGEKSSGNNFPHVIFTETTTITLSELSVFLQPGLFTFFFNFETIENLSATNVYSFTICKPNFQCDCIRTFKDCDMIIKSIF